MRIARRMSALLLPAALVLTAACGGPDTTDDSASSTSAGNFPVTVKDARGEVTIDEAPERIVSLSPSTTEMLFAIDAGDQVVAADDYSNYPEEAPTTDLSGFTPNVEAITEEDPDLVILARSAEDAAEQLEKVGVPVLVLDAAASLDDTYDQIRLLGKVTGDEKKADAEADRVESEIDTIVTDTKKKIGDTDLTYYHEVDDTMYSATSDTFIGQIYGEFGLENIADKADDAASGYPQLSPEFIVEENPDLIFLAYAGKDAVADVEDRPAFDKVSAVKDGNIVQLDEDISSRWGPRVVDLAQDVSDAVLAAEEN
ncbi:ABC transporter substrate-binding protein [Nocardiopsis gilva YIM 90087]|uniref:ABC transporter substrate-binding protein n=1 Tax=Nocardiopsis gilva YIM 90087 TaxID=1235441 RepID=A0A223S411_9ACTN|nr:ABC transporter substrate-binding protein [Nocardiopsis gilva]ASU82876.1 ABC transporter substrate-binding protein [Nocardiopsis gilva YIM 90087]